MTKTLLIGIAKDEGPFLWEWVAYHRSIGFSDIVVFENDSTDFSQGILKAMQEAGFVHNFFNPAPVGKHQIKAYQRAGRMDLYKNADWVMAIDLDEFLTIKVGDGMIHDLTARVDNLDCVLVNWRIFGNSHQNRMEQGLVTERFVMANRPQMIRGRMIGHKGFFRPEKITRPGVHFPVMRDETDDTFRIANGSGGLLRSLPEVRWQSKDPGMQALVQLNHYAVKDAESFVQKAARGRAHQNNAKVRHEYWCRNNINHVADVSILRHMQRTRRVMHEMDLACGGELSRFTKRAFDVHRSKIDTLLREGEFRRLFEQCSGEMLPALGAQEVQKV